MNSSKSTKKPTKKDLMTEGTEELNNTQEYKKNARNGKHNSNMSGLMENDFKYIILKDKQQEYFNMINNNTITICQGPAGSSKTFSACYAALKLLSEGKFDKIVMVKPIEESGEKLGALPGTVAEKVGPYLESYITNMSKIIDEKTLGFLMTTEKIIFKPLAYLRGVSLDHSIILCDESQNLDMRQLILLTTRLGIKSKLIIMADISQYDIKKNLIALPKFAEMLKGIDNIGQFNFTSDDIVRNKILIEITKRYELIREQFENKK